MENNLTTIDKEKLYKAQEVLRKDLKQYYSARILSQHFANGKVFEKYLIHDKEDFFVLVYEITCKIDSDFKTPIGLDTYKNIASREILEIQKTQNHEV